MSVEAMGPVIGMWPGRGFTHNPVIAALCDAAEGAGARVVEVDDPRTADPAALDTLHIHWPERALREAKGKAAQLRAVWGVTRALARLRRRGVKVVWMVHNLEPHDSRAWGRIVWAIFRPLLLRQVDGVMTLSPATLPVVSAALRLPARLPGGWTRHPAYPFSPPSAPPEALRARLETPPGGRLLLFFGVVRRYKGVEDLAAAFRALADPLARLRIAGRSLSPELSAVLREAAEADGRLRFDDAHQDDRTLDDLLLAADLAVLPFRQTLHSGSLMKALSQGRPVLTPDTPFARDLAETVGPGWVRTYAGRIGPEALAAAPAPEGRPDLSAFGLAAVGERLAAFHRAVAAGRPAP